MLAQVIGHESAEPHRPPVRPPFTALPDRPDPDQSAAGRRGSPLVSADPPEQTRRAGVDPESSRTGPGKAPHSAAAAGVTAWFRPFCAPAATAQLRKARTGRPVPDTAPPPSPPTGVPATSAGVVEQTPADALTVAPSQAPRQPAPLRRTRSPAQAAARPSGSGAQAGSTSTRMVSGMLRNRSTTAGLSAPPTSMTA